MAAARRLLFSVFCSIVYWFVRSFLLPGLERKWLASFNEIWQVRSSNALDEIGSSLTVPALSSNGQKLQKWVLRVKL